MRVCTFFCTVHLMKYMNYSVHILHCVNGCNMYYLICLRCPKFCHVPFLVLAKIMKEMKCFLNSSPDRKVQGCAISAELSICSPS